MEKIDKSKSAVYNKRTKSIVKDWNVKQMYPRKEYLELRQKVKADYDNFCQQEDRINAQLVDLKENKRMCLESMNSFAKVTKLFEVDMKKECKKVVIELMKSMAYDTHCKTYSDWDDNSKEAFEFENKRTKILKEIHTNEIISGTYPDYMIREVVWSDEFNPKKKDYKVIQMNNYNKNELDRIKINLFTGVISPLIETLTNRPLTTRVMERRDKLRILGKKQSISTGPCKGLGPRDFITQEPEVHFTTRKYPEIEWVDRNKAIITYELSLLDDEGKEVQIYPKLRDLRGTTESRDMDLNIIKGHIGELTPISAYSISETYETRKQCKQKITELDQDMFKDLINYAIGKETPRFPKDMPSYELAKCPGYKKTEKKTFFGNVKDSPETKVETKLEN